MAVRELTSVLRYIWCEFRPQVLVEQNHFSFYNFALFIQANNTASGRFERFTYAPKKCRSIAISYHKMRLCNVPSLAYCVDIAQNSRLCIWSFTLLLICFSCLKGMTSAFVMIYWDANLSDRISKIKSFLPCYMSFTLCLCFSVRILISRCSGRRIYQSGSTIQTTSTLF